MTGGDGSGSNLLAKRHGSSSQSNELVSKRRQLATSPSARNTATSHNRSLSETIDVNNLTATQRHSLEIPREAFKSSNFAVIVPPRRLSSTPVLDFSKPLSQSIRLRRRKRQSRTKKRSEHWEEIPLHIYPCRWAGCQAELHNIEVIREHVRKVHCHPSEDGAFECFWLECGTVIPRESGGEIRLRFTSEADWYEHVNTEHLEPLAWKYGDGPFAGQPSRLTNS